MSSLANDLYAFLQTQTLWIVALITGLVSGIKYLDNKQTHKIKDEVKDEIAPYITNICNQLTELKHSFELNKQKTELVIESIDRAIMHFQALEEGKEVRDYRLRKESTEKFG